MYTLENVYIVHQSHLSQSNHISHDPITLVIAS